MLGCMTGSCLFSLLTTSRSTGLDGTGNTGKTIFGFSPLNPYQIAFGIFGVSGVAHMLVILASGNGNFVLLMAFTIFEMCVGLYFPVIGIIKSKVVPESCRSTLYNYFRIPLNVIVCGALLINLPVKVGFALTTMMLFANVYLLKELGSEWLDEGAAKPSKGTGEMSSMIGSKALDEGVPVEAGI